MNETYTIDDLNKALKKHQRKLWFDDKIHEAANWINNNKEIVIMVVPAAFGCISKTVKVVGKHANLKKEQNNKELYCYDRSLGHYWKLRRELTNDEWVAIDERKGNGERLGDILNDLRVLK